jgi:site-specific DNA recombinase
MKRVVIYTRFSPRPNADLSLSCDVQEKKAREYCEYREWDVRSVYRDKGVSGKSLLNRPELRRAIREVLEYQCVMVCYDMSRLSRSVRDLCELSARLDKRGCELVLLRENVDTRTATGRVFFHIMAALAQFERERTGERTRAMFKYFRENKRRCGLNAPYGYMFDPATIGRKDKDGNKLPAYIIPNPEEAEGLRIIMELHRKRANYTQICRALTNRGVKSRGDRWWPSTVKRIIKRELGK